MLMSIGCKSKVYLILQCRNEENWSKNHALKEHAENIKLYCKIYFNDKPWIIIIIYCR